MWAISRRGNSQYARAALVGGVLPVVLALVNQRLVARMVVSYDGRATALVCAALLAEIVVVGFLFAKLIEPGRGRWLAYVWMWLLLDFTVAPRIVDGICCGYPRALLAPALLSVQLVLVALWAVFGSTRWSIRWPVAAALLALGAGVPLAAHAFGPHQVVLLVTTQTAVFLVVCVQIRRRFRINIGDWAGWQFGAEPSAEANRSQFFLRDLVLWMTLAATLLALVRAFVLLSPLEISPLAGRETGVICVTGMLSALVLVAALGTLLGQESVVVRWSRLAGMGVLAVVLLGVYYYVHYAWRGAWPGSLHPLLSRSYWEFFLTGKWHLLGWMGLSVAMLIASLVFLRAQAYRLCRPPRDS